jgi:hypothetical protein
VKIDIFNHILPPRFFAEFLKIAPGLKDMGKRSRNIGIGYRLALGVDGRLGPAERIGVGMVLDQPDDVAAPRLARFLDRNRVPRY